MNILFCSYNEKWQGTMLQKIVSELKADTVVSLSKINHDLQLKADKYHWIDNRYFIEHQYDIFMNEDLPIIDSKLLEKMYPFESLYYPMLERYEINNFVSISYQQRKKYYKQDISALLWLLKCHNIDICVFNNIPHIGYDYLLYGLCKVLNIPVVVEYVGVLIPHKSSTVFFLNDIYDPIPSLKEIEYAKEQLEDKEKLSTRMQAYIDQYNRDKEKIISFVSMSTFVKTGRIKTFPRVLVERLKEKQFVLAIRRKLHRYLEGKKVNRYLDKISQTDIGNKYIYYPLHYQPECTSLPMGGEYYDQLLVIKMISRNLPDGVELYVKPHPNRSLYADEAFYREILALKNVKIISKNVNTYELIDKALAIVSLTGTVILESLVRKKNVLMFGYYIWQYAPGVFHCKTEADCICALQYICSDQNNEDMRLVGFLSKLDEHLIDGIMTEHTLPLGTLDIDTNIENVSRGCVEFVRNTLQQYCLETPMIE